MWNEKAHLRLSKVDSENELENRYKRFQAKRDFDKAITEVEVQNNCNDEVLSCRNSNEIKEAPVVSSFDLTHNLGELQIQLSNQI